MTVRSHGWVESLAVQVNSVTSRSTLQLDIDGSDQATAMNDLRQLTLHGHVAAGAFNVERRRWSLQTTPQGWRRQFAASRQLARRAATNRARLVDWPTIIG
ncbi:MAG TPA: hypothetical protein VES40_11495 [Ilumatobacteraceae bacterium]|nr:hypothetical protein [Ilumatobacteraceae bacterium]